MAKRALSGREFILTAILLTIIIVSSISFGLKLGYEGRGFNFFTKENNKLADITRAYNIIANEYSGEFNAKKASRSAIEALIKSLGDKNSYYLSEEEYQKVKDDFQGKFTGIGILYGLRNDKLLIADVIPNSPAAAADLKKTDQIIKIDGIYVKDLAGLEEIKKKLQGKDGAKVALTLVDPADHQREAIILRKSFNVPALSFKTLDKKIGYLKVYTFNKKIKEEFSAIAKKLKTEVIKDLIIDLRDNTGGTENTAADLIGEFISQKTKAPYADLKLFILVNSQTASEAEVFVAAVKDNKRGLIIGEKTYGKGTKQNIFKFSDGSAMNLTTGKWYTSKGDWIEGKGISPDIKIKDTVDADMDLILEETLKLVKSS